MSYILETMPHAEESMQRVVDWYEQKVVDRAPVRFSAHNSRHDADMQEIFSSYHTIKDFWFDTETQIRLFLQEIEGKFCYGETFPVFYPNLGPSVYASYYGVELLYSDITSWAQHCIDDIANFEVSSLNLDTQCETFLKIDELTEAALKKGAGKFLTGYTDLHPSVDCVADFMGPEKLCMALYDQPEQVKELTKKLFEDFPYVFEYYHKKRENMPSVTWMGIPTQEKMHIPSCDFSAMLSPELFEEFCLPYLLKEVKLARYNIFHLDGPGVARHLDVLLDIDEIQAIQWVQGLGDDEPIMQWVPMIKKIQEAGKSVVVGLKPEELKPFMREVSPKGIYLTMNAAYEEQEDILKLIGGWK